MNIGGVALNLPTLTFSAAAFLAPLLSIYAPLAMAPLLAVTGVILAFGLIAERRLPQLNRPAVWIAAALMLWCVASLAWTINPKGALVTLGQLSGFLLCTLIVFASARAADNRPVAKALLIGIAAALVIYAVEQLFGAPIQSLFKFRGPELEAIYSSFNRGLAVLILLTPVAIIAFRKAQPRLALALTGASTGILFFYYGTAMELAALIALAVFVAALLGPWVVRLLGVLAVIGILAAPFIARSLITPSLVDTVSSHTDTISAQHRLIIWRFVSERIMEKPIVGWGLDSARAIPGGKDTVKVHIRKCQEPCYYTAEQLPLHTHNMAMQLWLELGLIGAALGAIGVLGVFWAIAAAAVSRWDRAILAAQASAGLVIAGLSYGAWQIWWLSALALAGALSLCVLRQRNDQESE